MIALMRRDDFVTVRDRFRAEKFAMTLGERDSTATITVGPDAPEIIINDILRDEDEPGAGIVWRVSRVDTDYKTETRTISCNHVIRMLKEKLLFGEQTTATICHRAGATTCSAKEAMRYVLSFQRDFELGDFPAAYESVSNAYSFNGDDLLSAMETISATLEDCWWEYDLRSYPFKLHLRDRRQAKVETELRLSRNIQNAKLTVDTSSMFTRLFPIGKNDLHLSGNPYVSRNENLYGMICKTETNAEKETDAALRSWAETELKYGAEPAVTVTITAMDLSQQTGEPLDHIMLGSICQMPLPEFGTTILERINRMSWADKIKDPNNITVTLANTRTTATSIVANAIKSSSKSSRVSTSNTVKGVLAIDLTTDTKDKNKYILWSQDYKGVWKDIGTFNRAVASWTVSASGGTIKVTANPQGQTTNVKVRGKEGGVWRGNEFEGQIEYYSADSGKTWKATGAYYKVDATARYNAGRKNGWTSAYNKVVLPKSTVTNINSILIKTPPKTLDGAAVSTSYILSSYDNNHVDLQTKVGDNYITVARLTHGKYTAGWRAAYNKVDLPKTEVTNINSILIRTPPYTVDGSAELTSYIMWSYDNNHVDLQTLVGGEYVTVARYTHSKYNDGWHAAANKVELPKSTVTNVDSILIKTPPYTVDGAAESTSYILWSADDNHVDLRTNVDGSYITVARITHGKYNAGWAAAKAKVSYQTTEKTDTNSFYIYYPSSTVDYQLSDSFVLREPDHNTVDFAIWNSASTSWVTVARKEHGQYTSGWNAARSAETRITMTRGAYDSQSRTYECTCRLNSTLAPSATFYLYAR